MKSVLFLALPLAVLSACATPAAECRAPVDLPRDLLLDQGSLPPEDYGHALWQLRRRAQYDPQAEYLLGLIYEEGIGIEADRKTAAALYYHAGKAGEPKARFRLAYALWEGIDGSSTNKERYEARDIFSSAAGDITVLAQAGDAEAQYMLGYLYGTGKAFPIDRAQAATWYLKAAEQGHARAQYEIGRSYRSDNPEEALKWFRRAAESGHAEAQNLLGEAYRWGVLGVTPDKVEAMAWYGLAADNGNAAAAYAREELAKQMTAAELGAAQARHDRYCGGSSNAI